MLGALVGGGGGFVRVQHGVGGPGDDYGGEGFGDEEAVPGFELPRAQGVEVEGACVACGALGEQGEAGFGDVDGPAWSVSGKGGEVSRFDGGLKLQEGDSTSAGGRASNGGEAEEFDRACDELTVEGLGDEDGDIHVAEAVRCHQQRAMPEAEDAGGRSEVSGCDAGVAHVAEAQGAAQQSDKRAGYRRHSGKKQSLFACEVHRPIVSVTATGVWK